MNNIKSLCSQIKKESVCPLCKGSFHMDECQSCGYKSPFIKKHIDKLLPMLDQNISSEELFSLYTLKPLGYDKINLILSLSGVEDYLKSKEEKILNQTRYELSDEKVMLYFIENNFSNKNEMINRLIKEMLSDNLDLTIEEKLSLFKYFTLYLLSKKIDNPGFTYISSDRQENHFENEISFDENEVRNLFYERRYLELLELVFYKVNILYQDKLLNSGNMSYLLLKMAKEKVISEILHSYYEENLYSLTSEVSARYNAIILLRNYVSFLGFKMSDKLMSCFEEREKNDLNLLNSDYRVYHGKSVNIDDLFLETLSKISDKTSIFEKYPILNMENNNATKKM